MAWTASEIFTATVEDLFENTTAMDVDTDTHKCALYDNTITPDQTVTSANTAYNAGQWVTGGEVDDGTNWDAGGEPLTGVSSTGQANGTFYEFDATDTPQGGATTTLASVYGCLIYDDTITTPVADQGWAYLYFGGAQSVTAGTFTVVYDANGILRITL